MIVALPSQLTIANVAEWKAILLGALGENKEVKLDAHALTGADVAGLQLLLSAWKSARAARVTFEFLPGRRSEALDRAALEAGLVHGEDSAEERFWKET